MSDVSDPGFHVYVITNTVNGKQYAGMTSRGVQHRWAVHVSESRRGKKLPLHSAIAKYGAESFLVEHVASCRSAHEMGVAEQCVIDQIGSLIPGGYNIAQGGRGGAVPGAGRKPSKDGKKGAKCLSLSPDVVRYLKDMRAVPGMPSSSVLIGNLIRESDEFLKFIGVPLTQKMMFIE